VSPIRKRSPDTNITTGRPALPYHNGFVSRSGASRRCRTIGIGWQCWNNRIVECWAISGPGSPGGQLALLRTFVPRPPGHVPPGRAGIGFVSHIYPPGNADLRIGITQELGLFAQHPLAPQASSPPSRRELALLPERHRATRRCRTIGPHRAPGGVPPQVCPESAIQNPQSGHWVCLAQLPSVPHPRGPLPPGAAGELASFCTIAPSRARRPPDVPSCPSLALFFRGSLQVLFIITPFPIRSYTSFGPSSNWVCLAQFVAWARAPASSTTASGRGSPGHPARATAMGSPGGNWLCFA
jgi:hypothetical protein